MKDAAKKFRKTCEKCNKPFSAASEEETLCRECRMREDFAKRRAEDEAMKEARMKGGEAFETRTCADCGTEFIITNREHDFLEKRGYSMPTRCPDCRRLHRDFVKKGLDNIGLESTCAECGKPLQFTNRELYWYASHNYKLPTRCKDCRVKRNEHFAKVAARREKAAAEEQTETVVQAPAETTVVAETTPVAEPAAPVVETPAAPDVNVPNAPAAEVKEEQGVPMLSGDMSAEPAPVPVEKSKDETV